MALNKLQKNYDVLNPLERLALLMAAATRQDERERDALMGSAPTVAYDVKHHYFVGEWLNFAAAVQMCEWLETGGMFSMATWLDERGRDLTDALTGIEAFAKRYRTTRAAWRKFAAANGFDLQSLFAFFPGVAMLDYYDQAALSFSLDDLNPAEVEELAHELTQELHERIPAADPKRKH